MSEARNGPNIPALLHGRAKVALSSRPNGGARCLLRGVFTFRRICRTSTIGLGKIIADFWTSLESGQDSIVRSRAG